MRGVTFLNILGVDYSSSTTYIIVLDCMYVIFILAGLAFIYFRTPKPSRLRYSKTEPNNSSSSVTLID